MYQAGGQPQFNANSIKKIIIPNPPIDLQQRIVEEIEAERQLVEANKELINIYEQKIQAKLAEVWGAEKNGWACR